MTRPRHPNKEVEAAIRYAEEQGWSVRMQGHWGRLYCSHHDRDGCQTGVYSTPANSMAHARGIKRAVDRCPHKETKEAE